MNIFKGIAICALAAGTVLTGAACGSESQGPLDGVEGIVFIQRPKRNETGDIFQYTSYRPGARIVKLSPPTADGELTVLCCDQDPDMAGIDISGYDLSFNGDEIVFSGRNATMNTYGLFVLTLADNKVEQLLSNPNRDYVSPLFVPGDKIVFTTNEVVEAGAPQHRDEYERGTTLQLGVVNRDGSGEVLGARNLSHRVFPTLLSSGRIMFTQWDHLGEMNEGHLMTALPDLTSAVEAFGKQGTGASNSYLKAIEISPGRVLAIGTARDRTVQAGALLDIRLGKAKLTNGNLSADIEMSEANASYRILTPSVPLGREPSSVTVGRYYDAFPLNAREYPDLIVSWADGPVESSTLEAAGVDADFGIYLYDSERQTRRPIWNDPEMWDVFPRTLTTRTAPPKIESGKHGITGFDDAALLAAMNVYDTSLGDFEPGEIYGVRVIEGFSTEEGIPDDFGITEHEGAAVLGVAEIKDDNSWAALIPANVPVHLQAIDEFGLSRLDENVWIQAAAGESRACGGCHEDRAKATIIDPGATLAVIRGPKDMRSKTPRAERVTTSLTRDNIVGIAWDGPIQDIFDAKCISCHAGQATDANPEWSIMDPVTGLTTTWRFNLTGGEASYGVGTEMISGYSASHLSIMGPDMMDLEDAGLVIVGEPKIYARPGDARGSELTKKLNPVRQFPDQDDPIGAPAAVVRAFDEGEFPAHAKAQGVELTADEYYLLTLMIDNGGQFYSRENAPEPAAP